MQAIELIGKVAAHLLKDSIQTDNIGDGVARFLLNRLTEHQVIAICNAILSDHDLAVSFKIQVPRALVGDQLPPDLITDESTVHLRHADCDRPALLLASTSDDQAQSLNDITPIGADELKAEIPRWIDLAADSLNLPSENIKYWNKALSGLQKAETLSLEHFAEYIVQTRDRILTNGLPVMDALGWALPALRLPRDSGYFGSIPGDRLGRADQWQKLFRQAFSKRACLLRKQSPTGQSLDENALQSAFEQVKEEIHEEIHPVIQKFINSPSKWTDTAAELAKFEWESDRINTLFSGLKSRKTDIASQTIDFFQDKYPEVLKDEEQQYLEILKKRRKNEPNEEDREFYDAHREELANDRRLKAKWDKFVYGQPIECTDFLVGLLQTAGRLFQQDENDSGNSSGTLKISTQKGQSKAKWLELNTEVGIYFCTRYRGLQQLTAPEVTWETYWLFKYDRLIEETKKKQGKKYRENTSASKLARSIKFYVEMLDSHGVTIAKTQLIWHGNPNAIGMELSTDLKRLTNPKHSPFQRSQVSQELVSKKGRLQGLSLSDVGTLMAAYRQDRGSLIGKYDAQKDLGRILSEELKKAEDGDRISRQTASNFNTAWQTFATHYRKALQELSDPEGQGIASPELFSQADAYQKLLEFARENLKGDLNRIKLCQPILDLGCVRVERGKPSAIITPWHPLRLVAIASKARQLAGLLRYILSHEVDFGDIQLFFTDLTNELKHPYYPEVCVGYQGQQPEILVVSDTVNDYSLLECPLQNDGDRTTNENPAEAVKRLIATMDRYVELLPHEQTNLSVVLYQTDSIQLPQAIIKKLSERLQDEDDEVRCQVYLRHRDRKKLSKLYEQILESTDSDPDSFIASEVSQDFIARLRIAVISQDTPTINSREGKFADIVFLQDAISRQAELDWQPSPFEETENILLHSPPRWSRKRPLAKDELKSIAYLTCPKQTAVGQAYLDLVYSIIKSEDCVPDQHFLPALKVSFQNETIKTTFEESHRLGEWVVNFDSLLERRQLKNQGVRVIRYQQNRTEGRNFLVSSDTSLSVLKALIYKRLNALNLDLDNHRLDGLADRLIEDANSVSGDIVLRAAKCGKFAGELVGVVLSRALIAEELGYQHPIGWYFLDDYASWLGQKEGRIADIMAISPQNSDDPVLKIILSEAKYVDLAGLADARKTSQNQLRQTANRIFNALFVSPGRLDRDLWLTRLSDLLLEGIEFKSSDKSNLDIEQWREKVRSGSLQIALSGYSHVFVTGSNESDLTSERVAISKAHYCFQEVFSRDAVRRLILAYEAKEDLLPIRAQLGDRKPWETLQAQYPADRVTWISTVEEIQQSEFTDTTKKEDISSSVSSPHPFTFKSERSDRKVVVDNFQPQPQESATWSNPNFFTWLQSIDIRNDLGNDEARLWLEESTKTLQSALMGYGLQAKILGSRLTPNAGIIRFKGSDRLRLEDIEKKHSQLLTTHALDIINTEGQPGEIVVSIARPQRQTVSLREVWLRRKTNISDSSNVNLSFAIGIKEIDGEILYLNLGSSFENLTQHAPHTLIAGATGSGKSVLLQNLLLDICVTNSPEQAHIYLIDPKMGVDYVALGDLPHLQDGIITEREQSQEVMNFLVEQMESRYRKFISCKAKDLQSYNNKVDKFDRLPFIWLVHDEFAEWMLIDEYKAAVSTTVQRLGVKARAAGIYLIFAAQRPDANVLPVQLRDNLGNRLILRVESVGTSEIALGQKGAEKLLGKGHLVARLTNQPNLIYAQVPFLSDDEVEDLVKLLKS